MKTRLGEIRKRAGFTQKSLAAEMGYKGISHISGWENGNTIPPDKVGVLANLFGMTEPEFRAALDEVERDKSYLWREKIARSNEDEGVRFLLMCLPIFEDGGIVAVTPEIFAKTIHVDESRVREDWPKMMKSDFVEVVGVPELGVLRLRY